MSLLEAASETAGLYIKLGDLRQEKRDLIMQAGLKAYDLNKRGQLESSQLHKLSDDITDINNAIQVAAQEAKLEKKKEFADDIPQWKIFLENVGFQILNTAERLEAKRRHDSLVSRGQEYLEEAGTIALTLTGKNEELERLCLKVRQIDQKLHKTVATIEERERKGVAGPGFLVSIISFASTFSSFFRKTKF